eukprot:1179413-Prorocentrum_minimum.AAC.7
MRYRAGDPREALGGVVALGSTHSLRSIAHWFASRDAVDGVLQHARIVQVHLGHPRVSEQGVLSLTQGVLTMRCWTSGLLGDSTRHHRRIPSD